MFLYNHPPNPQAFLGPHFAGKSDCCLSLDLCSDTSIHEKAGHGSCAHPITLALWWVEANRSLEFTGGSVREPVSKKLRQRMKLGHPSSSGLQRYFHTDTCLYHNLTYPPPLSLSLCLCLSVCFSLSVCVSLFLSFTHTLLIAVSIRVKYITVQDTDIKDLKRYDL